jgi:hypothetical protein
VANQNQNQPDPAAARQAAQAAQQAANAAAQQSQSTDALRESLRDILFLQRDYVEEAKAAAKATFDSNIQASATSKVFKDISSSTRNIQESLGDVVTGNKSLYDLNKDIAVFEKNKKALLVEQEQALNKILSTVKDQEGNLLSEEKKRELINDSLKDNSKLQDLIFQHGREMTEEQRVLLDLYSEQNQRLVEQESDLSEVQKRAKNINDAFKGTGIAAEGLSGVINKLGGSKLNSMLGIDDAVNKSKQFAAELTEGGTKTATIGDKFKVAGNLAKNLGKNLTEALGPIALITMAIEELINAFKMVDSLAGDTAKELGISYDEARQLTNAMNDVAMSSNDIMNDTQSLVKAQSSLNNMFGTSVQFSNEMAEDFSSIQQRLKLSDQAMESFTRLGLENGNSLKNNLSIVDDTLLKLNYQNKTAFSQKQIQEAIGKTSAATRLTLKGNVAELTRAAVEAKKLGLEIEDLGKVSSHLLNFEESISSELEAELLTGKDLNLERARAAALNGNQADLAKEINQQIGTSVDFGKKNVIQQEALAKAFGMSREDLAKMLEEQENLQKIQKSGFKDLNSAQEEYNKMAASGATQAELDAKFKDKALQSQLASVSMQERFEKTTQRLKEVFVSLIEPLMPVFELLQDLFEGIVKPLMQVIGPMIKELSSGLMSIFEPIKGIFTDIGDIMGQIFGKSTDMSKVFSTIGKVLGSLLNVVFVPLKATITFLIQGVRTFVDIFGGVVDIFQGKFEDGFKKIVKGIIGFIARPFQFLIDIVTGTINAVINGLNKIPGVKLSEINFNIADAITGIMPMAKGGIVTQPTKALVGEAGPEAVIPLNKLSDIINSPSAKKQNTDNVNNNSDALLKEFKEMKQILSAILNKEGTITLNGTKMGTAMAVGSYKIQ